MSHVILAVLPIFGRMESPLDDIDFEDRPGCLIVAGRSPAELVLYYERAQKACNLGPLSTILRTGEALAQPELRELPFLGEIITYRRDHPPTHLWFCAYRQKLSRRKHQYLSPCKRRLNDKLRLLQLRVASLTVRSSGFSKSFILAVELRTHACC